MKLLKESSQKAIRVRYHQGERWCYCVDSKASLKEDPRVLGSARIRKELVKTSSGLTWDRRVWGASIRDLVSSAGDAGPHTIEPLCVNSYNSAKKRGKK